MTEQSSDGTPLDALSALEIVRRMNIHDARVPGAVACAESELAAVVESAARALTRGGRLIYIGAGTSGRLGVLDASECSPTFGVPRDRVVGIIAGGERALRESVEGVEDDSAQGARDVREAEISPRDLAVGIAASGRTPYVLAALDEARAGGADTALICCRIPEGAPARIVVVLATGLEVLAGSTRLKAGTAMKMALNTISTGAMALAGYVHEGLMVGVRPVNAKLRRRALRILGALLENARMDASAIERLLEEAGGRIPVAVVMARKGVPREEAARRLKECGGSLRGALRME